MSENILGTCYDQHFVLTYFFNDACLRPMKNKIKFVYQNQTWSNLEHQTFS